jgi:Maleate cis-trans isomerase
MVDFMETSGFEVVHSEVVGFVASIELGRVGPEQAYELGLRTTGRTRTPSSCPAATGRR